MGLQPEEATPQPAAYTAAGGIPRDGLVANGVEAGRGDGQRRMPLFTHTMA